MADAIEITDSMVYNAALILHLRNPVYRNGRIYPFDELLTKKARLADARAALEAAFGKPMLDRERMKVTFPLTAENVAQVVAERDAEIERLNERFFPTQNQHKGWKWWCCSCGSLTNDGECDCTEFDDTADQQRLIRNP